MFGDVGVFWGSFYVIVFNIVTWTYGMYILGRARSSIKINFVKMIWNYGTTPCLIGLALFIFRVKLPSPVLSAMIYLGSLCTPISMLIVGSLLATIPFKKLFSTPKIYYSCAIRLIIIPLIVILIGKAVGLGRDMLLFSAIMACVPTAANSAMFAERYDLETVYAAHVVGMSTLLSAATIPLMIWVALL